MFIMVTRITQFRYPGRWSHYQGWWLTVSGKINVWYYRHTEPKGTDEWKKGSSNWFACRHRRTRTHAHNTGGSVYYRPHFKWLKIIQFVANLEHGKKLEVSLQYTNLELYKKLCFDSSDAKKKEKKGFNGSQ